MCSESDGGLRDRLDDTAGVQIHRVAAGHKVRKGISRKMFKYNFELIIFFV